MKTPKAATIIGRIAVVFIILLVAVGGWGLHGYLKFRNRLEELKADGYLIPFDEIIHHVPDPQNDALTYLKQTFPIAKEFAKTLSRDSRGYPRVKADAFERLEKLNTSHPEFFRLVSDAANAPDMSFCLDDDQNSNVSILDLQNVLNVLLWKGYVLLSKGDQPGAIEVAQELLKISRLIKQPVLLNAMLGIAFQNSACDLIFESLMIGKVDAAMEKRIRQSLDSLDLDSACQNALKGELSIFLYNLVESNSRNDSQGFLQGSLAPLLAFGMPTTFGNQYLDQMELAFERTQMPLSLQFPKKVQNTKWIKLPGITHVETELFSNARNVFGRVKVKRQCVLILLALAADENSPRREEWSLDYLASIGVNNADAIDPFSSAPLIIRHQKQRWTIHSVGPNQVDENGKPGSDDIGCGLRK